MCTLYLNNRARTAGGAHTRVLSRTSAGVGGVAVERSAYRGIVSARARACVRLERCGRRAVETPSPSGPLFRPVAYFTSSPVCRPPRTSICIYIPLRPLARRPARPLTTVCGLTAACVGGGGSVGVGGGCGGGHYVTYSPRELFSKNRVATLYASPPPPPPQPPPPPRPIRTISIYVRARTDGFSFAAPVLCPVTACQIQYISTRRTRR